MPVYINLLENAIIGAYYKRGLDEGELKGEVRILRRLIEKRFVAMPSGVEERLAEWPAKSFGAIPDWPNERLAACSAAELEELSVRIFDATGIEDLLR